MQNYEKFLLDETGYTVFYQPKSYTKFVGNSFLMQARPCVDTRGGIQAKIWMRT